MTILALLIAAVGVIFLIGAALGLLRFPDPLQRMHASTKAGTVGAVCVVLGAVLISGQPGSGGIAAVTILFLLLTMPVAAHLLGRAIYISGARLVGLDDTDALKGKLARRDESGVSGDSRSSASFSPRAVRLALMAPGVDQLICRARDIVGHWDVPLYALAIVDEEIIASSPNPQALRPMIRKQVAREIERLRELLPPETGRLSLVFEEGDPMALIPQTGPEASLLILPPKGWCDHGIEESPSRQDTGGHRLLRLGARHEGPVLYVGEKSLPARSPRIAVLDDGSDGMLSALAWAVATCIWTTPSLYLVGTPSAARLTALRAALASTGVSFSLEVLPAPSPGFPLLPKQAADFDGLVTDRVPEPESVDVHGQFWHETIAKGWHGEVLLIPHRH